MASRPYSHHQGKLHERLMLPDLRVGYSFDAKAPISVHSQIIRTSAAAAHLGLNGWREFRRTPAVDPCTLASSGRAHLAQKYRSIPRKKVSDPPSAAVLELLRLMVMPPPPQILPELRQWTQRPVVGSTRGPSYPALPSSSPWSGV